MNGNHIVYSLGSNICENHFLQNHATKDFLLILDVIESSSNFYVMLKWFKVQFHFESQI